MDTLMIELPEGVKAKIEKHLEQREFANANEYVLSLLMRDIELADVDRMLEEAEEEYERGECVVHKKGDIIRMGEEMIRRRLEAKKQ